jgi:hypothetical protein
MPEVLTRAQKDPGITRALDELIRHGDVSAENILENTEWIESVGSSKSDINPDVREWVALVDFHARKIGIWAVSEGSKDDDWQHEEPGRINEPPTEEPERIETERSRLNDLWLPSDRHWDLHISHRPLEDGGALLGRGGRKIVLHTVEAPWHTVDAMYRVLRDKRAAPHLLIGGRPGVELPIVIQMIPFNRAGRALEHPGGTPATNAGGEVVIQVEMCGFAASSHEWSQWRMKAIANMLSLVLHRQEVPLKAPVSFEHPHRLSPQEWIIVSGILGHCHVPHNTHTDPGRFKVATLIKLIKQGQHDLSRPSKHQDLDFAAGH